MHQKFHLFKKERNVESQKAITYLKFENCLKNIWKIQIPDKFAETLVLGNKYSIPFKFNKIPINIRIASIKNCIKNIERDELA